MKKSLIITIVSLLFAVFTPILADSPTSDSKLIQNMNHQKNYLIRLYNDLKLPNKDIYIKHINNVKIELMDSIPFDGRDIGVMGIYYEPIHRIAFARRYISTSAGATVYIHEFTHAAYRNYTFMPASNYTLIQDHLLTDGPVVQDKATQVFSWRYWTRPTEVFSQVSGVRYLLDMRDFDNHSWISYQEFVARKSKYTICSPSNSELEWSDQMDFDLYVLSQTAKSDYHLYQLLINLK